MAGARRVGDSSETIVSGEMNARSHAGSSERRPSRGDRVAAIERAWRFDVVAGLGAGARFREARECERRNRHHQVPHGDVEVVAGRQQIDRDAAESDGGHIAAQPGVACKNDRADRHLNRTDRRRARRLR